MQTPKSTTGGMNRKDGPLDDQEIAKRRSRVMKLLGEATDLKRWHRSTQEATERARKAYKEATAAPRLESPWPELAAYRLAHLLMRAAPRDIEELGEIESYFETATQNDVLGPIPAIYRLAILHRMMYAGGTKDCTLESTIDRAFETAYQRVKKLNAEMRHAEEPRERNPRIQDSVINLLEIATYFLGAKYDPIEGLEGVFSDAPFSDLRLGKGGYLVGPDPELATVAYPYHMACHELDQLAEKYPSGLFFKLTAESPKGEWRIGKGQWQRPGRKGTCKILAYVLRYGKPYDRGGLRVRQAAVGEWALEREPTDENFKAALKEVNSKLKEIHSKDETALRSDGEYYVLDRQLAIFGAVSDDVDVAGA